MWIKLRPTDLILPSCALLMDESSKLDMRTAVGLWPGTMSVRQCEQDLDPQCDSLCKYERKHFQFYVHYNDDSCPNAFYPKSNFRHTCEMQLLSKHVRVRATFCLLLKSCVRSRKVKSGFGCQTAVHMNQILVASAGVQSFS